MSMTGELRLVTDVEIDRLISSPETVEAFLFGEGDAGEDRSDLDLDKAWDGVHFLLTHGAEEARPPFDFLLAGGEELGEEDADYGPPRAHRSRALREIAAALEPLSSEALIERFDPGRMTTLGVYPAIWDREDERDDQREWLRDSYASLRDLVLSAARDGLGLIVSIV